MINYMIFLKQLKRQKMMNGCINCPIKQCGRKFENQQTMLEHVRRRHPGQYNSIKIDLTKSLIDREHAQQQQINKLPKLAKLMSRQKKTLETTIKSNSKSKRIQVGSANLSNIIQESRQITSGTSGTSKGPISTRRPSLSKKISAPDLKEVKLDKLPPIQKQLKKKIDSSFIQKKNSLNLTNNQTNQQMYTTLPDFKYKAQAIFRSKSKGKKKSQQNVFEQKLIQPQHKTSSHVFNNTMTTFSGQKNSQQTLLIDKKKSLYRPTKKLERKPSDKLNIQTTTTSSVQNEQKQKQKIDFDKKILNIKSWSQSIFICPNTSKIQLLYLNNCNLSNIVLNSLESLIELSATNNKLQDMQFLQYQKNTNIKVLHLDHNQITQIYTPPRLKIFTVSFNHIKAEVIEEVCSTLKKSGELEEIDFSFNNVRKAQNYKLKVLGVLGKVKKIDGLVVTKIDIEMMKQYQILESKQKGLIPKNSQGYDRPGTAVSEYYLQSQNDHEKNLKNQYNPTQKTIQQLETQQKKYQKQLKQTQEQLKIIRKENEIIESQLQNLNLQVKDMQINWDSAGLFYKLQKQCQFLELLNVMQYADEEQLEAMIKNKKIDLGIAAQ